MTDPIDLEKAIEFYKRHRWRKCSEEMPEPKIPVLACHNESYVRNGITITTRPFISFYDPSAPEYQGFSFWFGVGEYGGRSMIGPTHWAYLLEAPKADFVK